MHKRKYWSTTWLSNFINSHHDFQSTTIYTTRLQQCCTCHSRILVLIRLEDLKAQLALVLEWREMYMSGCVGARACHAYNCIGSVQFCIIVLQTFWCNKFQADSNENALYAMITLWLHWCLHKLNTYAGVDHVCSLCPCCLDCLEDVCLSFNFWFSHFPSYKWWTYHCGTCRHRRDEYNIFTWEMLQIVNNCFNITQFNTNSSY